MPGDDLALLGIPDNELLDMLKITCKVVGDQQTDRKFNFQTIQLSSGLSCKANTGQLIKTDNVDAVDPSANMPDYFRSRSNRLVDKIAIWF